MTIHKAKTSAYDSVNNKTLVRYISEHAAHIYGIVYSNNSDLGSQDRAQLKAIASELETVRKRLDYMLYGRY